MEEESDEESDESQVEEDSDLEEVEVSCNSISVCIVQFHLMVDMVRLMDDVVHYIVYTHCMVYVGACKVDEERKERSGRVYACYLCFSIYLCTMASVFFYIVIL